MEVLASTAASPSRGVAAVGAPMQSILESAIDAAIDAAPDVAPLILLGVPGGLSAAVEASKWDSSGLHRSVQAMVQMEASDCASLVLHRIVGAEAWRHAAANTMTRLHECRSDRYAPQLHPNPNPNPKPRTLSLGRTGHCAAYPHPNPKQVP